MTNIHIYKFKILCKHKRASEDFAYCTLEQIEPKPITTTPWFGDDTRR